MILNVFYHRLIGFFGGFFTLIQTSALFDVLIFALVRKEGNVLFNDELNTFYLRLYGVTHMVKDHSY